MQIKILRSGKEVPLPGVAQPFSKSYGLLPLEDGFSSKLSPCLCTDQETPVVQSFFGLSHYWGSHLWIHLL